jgi:hypothetical protein
MRRRDILKRLFADVPTKDLLTIGAAMLVCDGIIWAASHPDVSAEATRNLLFGAVCDLLESAPPQESICVS